MEIEMLRQFFMWCTILNFGLLLLLFLVLAFAGDFVYNTHNKWFAIPRETFNLVVYSFLGLYKMVWLVFSVVPWIALTIIA